MQSRANPAVRRKGGRHKKGVPKTNREEEIGVCNSIKGG